MAIAQTGLDLGNFLTYLTRRQEVIASNIANADTPGYKTQDMQRPEVFSAMFQEAAMVEETGDLPSRNDGNNVNMDREARHLTENTMRFSLVTQLIRGEIRNLKSAIEEGRSS